MAKYKFSNLFDVNSFKKGFSEIEKMLDNLNEKISGKDVSRTGPGKELMEEKKQIEKVIEAEKELIKIENERKKLEKEMLEANKKAAKEEQQIINTRIKAEKEAEKFLKQFNAEEIKRNEILKLRKKELRQNAQAEIALEKIQKKEVKTLKDLQDKNNALIRVRNNLDKTTVAGKKRFDELTQTIERNNRTLLNNDKNIGIFRRNVGNYASGFRSLISSIGGLSGVLSFASISGGIAAAGALITDFANRSKELGKITRQISNDFDVNRESAKKYAVSVKSIADTFDQDYKEILNAATNVSKQFDISLGEALANIEAGFEKGSNNSGEFISILKEYPAQFDAAGVDAQTFFAIVNQQVKSGIYTDKGIDAIKEAGLRLRENTKAVQAALAPLDESIKKQIEQEVAAGRSFEAIKLVSGALSDTSLTASQTQAIIADVFGGAGEDAGLKYLQTLKDIDSNLDNVAKQTSAVEQAQLGMNKSYNSFVSSVSDGTGIISEAWAGLIQGIDNIFAKLKQLNEGVNELTEAEKEYNGISQKTQERIKATRASIEEETTSVDRANKARKIRQVLTQQLIKLEYQAIKARQLGLKTEETVFKTRATELKKVIQATNQYIKEDVQATSKAEIEKTNITKQESDKRRSEREKENEERRKNNEQLIKAIKDAEIAAAGERFIAEKARIDEDLMRNKLRINALIADEQLKNTRIQQLEDEHQRKLKEIREKYDIEYADSRNDLDFDVAKNAQEITDKLTKDTNKARKKEIEERIKADEEAAKFYTDIRENALTRADQLAGSITEGRYQANINAIENEANYRSELLERQLANGEISEQLYRQKKEELAKETSRKQAEAEQERVLYEIKINTALAAIKAAPNPLAIAGALALGAAQYAFVKAFGLPAFKDGKINIQGEGTETSDSILARISKGESVIKAKATKKSTKILKLVNDEVINDSNASELLSKYTVNQLESRFMKSIESNTRETNNIIGRLGNVMQRKDGSYFIILANGKTENINLNG